MTLARLKTLTGRRFHKTMTLSAIAPTLRRHGRTHQAQARRAAEREEKAITGWVKEMWPLAENTAAALGAFLVFEDEAGFSMMPATSRTWSPRGHTPVVRVPRGSRARVSIAHLVRHLRRGLREIRYRNHLIATTASPRQDSPQPEQPDDNTATTSVGRRLLPVAPAPDCGFINAGHPRAGGPVVCGRPWW